MTTTPANLMRCGSPPWNLTERQIDVWCIQAPAPVDGIDRLVNVLSADERARAARFRFARPRETFIVARASLRLLLARYVARPAPELRFVYGSKGKPAVVGAGAVAFNLSHSHDVALFAFAAGCELGIDVERIRPLAGMLEIAHHNFCREEARELAALPESERAAAFFRCWTRKEAFIKATGEGLSTPLDEFRVTLRPGERARFLRIGSEPSAAAGWNLDNLDLAPSYAAALAYRDRPRPVLQFPLLSPSDLLRGI